MFHITATQFPNQNPHELGIRTHREPNSAAVATTSFSLLSFSCAFFLTLLDLDLLGFFFVTEIIGGFLSPSSHCHRAEAKLSPLSATWNEQDGKVLWVTKQTESIQLKMQKQLSFAKTVPKKISYLTILLFAESLLKL
ncbi:hypothetical protein CMV_021877 [Castanea mollissima]|uniref:Uncharacterized protein n=1 Tax=Castanea mollissima TaxID=60419 RepID=A0A8J4V8P1_9ROSI|nr:hypothetical protein CMV_021877 [Castanea mollissima]